MIYCYNAQSGEYSMTMPFEDELGEGRTTIEPPETNPGEVAVFDVENEVWNIEIDYRFTHKMLKNNEIFTIENFGPIPEGYILITNEKAAELEETARINKLTMTPLDFINFLKDSGLSLEQIFGYLDSNLEIKTQLTYCNSVYCGVAKSLMPIEFENITITAEMVEQAFIAKNPVKEPEETPEEKPEVY